MVSLRMKATLYLIFSACMWGLNFHLLQIMLSSVHFMEAGFWRYLFAVITLALFIRKPFAKWSLLREQLTGLLIVGILGLFCFNLLLFWGLRYTSAINASLIMSLNPVVTLLLSRFFLKSRISYYQFLGALVGMTGVVYLLSKGKLSGLSLSYFSKGDMLIVLAMILAAFYHIWVKKYAANISNRQFTFFTNLVCLLSFIIIIPLFVEPHPLNYSSGFWIASIIFGVLGTALTYIFWNKALGMVRATKAGVFMNIVPLSTAIITVLLGKELAAYHIASGGLIVLGLAISQLKTKKKPLSYKIRK